MLQIPSGWLRIMHKRHEQREQLSIYYQIRSEC